jgi:alpha-L-rhamnosidase
LTHACGKLKTPYGELVSQWQLSNDTFEWTVVVPPNTTATVYLPAQKEGKMVMNGQGIAGSIHEVDAGEYRIIR